VFVQRAKGSAVPAGDNPRVRKGAAVSARGEVAVQAGEPAPITWIKLPGSSTGLFTDQEVRTRRRRSQADPRYNQCC